MRDMPAEWLAEIGKREGLVPRVLLRIVAQNRTTLADETMCLWTGSDHVAMTVEGQTHTYYGAGSILGFGSIKNEIGTTIRRTSVSVAALTPEVAQLIRGYNVKQARVLMWTALFSPETGLMIGTPVRRFKGFVNKAPITTGAKGENSSATIELMSIARNLSKKVPSKMSDDNQKRRNNTDRFLRYVGVTGLIQTPWGTKTVRGDSPAAPSGSFMGRIFK